MVLDGWEGRLNYVVFCDFDVLIADEFSCAVCMVIRGKWFRWLGFNVFGVLLRRFIIRFRHDCDKKQNVEKQSWIKLNYKGTTVFLSSW